MYSSREEIEKEIFDTEIKLKELKKNYKKIMKSVKGIMSNETKEAARETRKWIKTTEREIIKAKLQLRLYL